MLSSPPSIGSKKRLLSIATRLQLRAKWTPSPSNKYEWGGGLGGVGGVEWEEKEEKVGKFFSDGNSGTMVRQIASFRSIE